MALSQQAQSHASKKLLVGVGVALAALVGVKGTRMTQAHAASDRADRCLTARDFPAAALEFRESIRLQPNKDVQYTLGTTLMRAGQRDEAMAVFGELAAGDDRVGGYARKTLAKMQSNPSIGRTNTSGPPRP